LGAGKRPFGKRAGGTQSGEKKGEKKGNEDVVIGNKTAKGLQGGTTAQNGRKKRVKKIKDWMANRKDQDSITFGVMKGLVIKPRRRTGGWATEKLLV